MKSPAAIEMKYGNSTVTIDISKARSVKFLQGKEHDRIDDLKSAFEKAVTSGVTGSKPLNQLLTKNDQVTIVVSDITRFWMRQDLICRELVNFLHDRNGIPYEHMVILVALGTHRGHSEEEQRKIVGEEVYQKVKVINHDAEASDLKLAGTTSRGTEVWVNPLAVGRKVILIGGTVHHLMAGFGGGRKSILPGISGKKTIVQNHLLCLDPELPRSNPAIGCAVLTGNPVHEDMMEAAAMVSPAFGINIITTSEGKHSHVICGDWEKAWLKSCEIVQAAFSVPIREKADIVIASCGGFPKDINLYQGIKTLLNMSYAVKPGGTMIFIAECREGGGSPDFFDWRIPLKDGALDEELRDHFTISGYIFYAGCEAIAKGNVRMLTSFSGDLGPEVLKDMSIDGYSDLNELLKKVDFTDKSVYVMPYGSNTLPWVNETLE
ncbi:nickel-dependent lactate racemase [Lachnospiraceae bacterium 54-53]